MKSYRSFPGLFCILFLIFGVSSYSLALEVPVFSPLRYSIDDVQGTAVYTDTVTMGNVVSGEFHLVVQNGSGGANKVDLAEVSIDGKILVKLTSKKDFKDKKFKLLKDSELRISLTGSKNSFVVVSIIAKKLTQVPLVIRMVQADAQAAMTSALLKIKKKPLFSSHGFVPSGSVISQIPSPGVYVKEKTKASITVSTGPDLFYALLPGTPDTPASSSVVDYNSHDTVADDEIIEVSPTEQIVLTKLMIAFQPDATVKQVNDLLTSIGAQITAMVEGTNQVIVRIPKPNSLSDLEDIVSSISTNSIVLSVLKASIPVAESLPPNFNILDPSPPWDKIDHHLDVRAHAAWNAKALLQQGTPPTLVVGDHFGEGPPVAGFAFYPVINGDFQTGKPDSHGYHVLGIIGATFGGDSSDRGIATGIYPGTLPLLVADVKKGLDDHTLMAELIQQVKLGGGQKVVSTSLSTGGCPNPKQLNCIDAHAQEWIRLVRGWVLYDSGNTNMSPTNLENSFIHITAAGNIQTATLTDTNAALSSQWTGARLLPGLVSPSGNPIINLTNTLVIENRWKSPTPLESLGCIDLYSKRPGNLSAIGTDVWSLTGATYGADYKSGTSMATPQVAGLTAYLWAIKPNLTPQQIIDILIRTADTSACGGIDARPLIDAYAAVLALDSGYASARVRGTLLDVTDASGAPGHDWQFNEKDVEASLSAFDAANGTKDYSRYDLNGDGKTGGDSKAKFNLDMDYPPAFNNVHQFIEEAHITFNENELTDLGILCYYAYSRLYTGDTDKRKDLLRDKCAELTAELTLPSSISPGGSGELQVRAGYIVPDKTTQWKEGINLSITVNGGTATSSTGTTDTQGYFITTVQHDGSSDLISVTATVTDSGEREITKTAVATSGPVDSVNINYLQARAYAGDIFDLGWPRCDQILFLEDPSALPLPASLTVSCAPYAQSTTTVQKIDGGHMTMFFSGSATRVDVPCEPPSPNCNYHAIISHTEGTVGGKIIGGAYTVEMSLAPSLSPPALGEQRVILSFEIPGRSFRCDWIEWPNDTLRSCCNQDSQGRTCFPIPVGPFTIDVDVPDDPGMTWSFSIRIGSSPEYYQVPGDVTLSDQVFSIKRK